MNPLSWFTGPYALWIKLGLVVAIVGGAYVMGRTDGKKLATADCSAEKLAAVQKYQAEYQKAVDRANALAQKLATRETQIIYRTKEVIKNVPKVTDGKSCLNSAALGMLNHRPDKAAVPKASGQSATEGAAQPAATDTAGATDTDVAYWIAEAISQYEIAAARLNALVDYFEDKQ